jgi:uncharacterized protein (DUF983 family)
MSWSSWPTCRSCGQPLVGYEQERDICESCWHEIDRREEIKADQPEIIKVCGLFVVTAILTLAIVLAVKYSIRINV